VKTQRKKLPIGIQNLREIREGGYYYVDKSSYACRLVSEGKFYFLSRPRRFGKSLFVDTLKELFEGHRELFTGLHADTHWDWSKKHPVLRFSFGVGGLGTREKLEQELGIQLANHAERLGIAAESLEQGRPALRALVRAAHAKFGQRVVILVDEYDKPILDHIEKPEIAQIMRDGLSDFYGAIKELDPHLAFVLLTGVSKFSKVNLFSKLNNLEDITLSKSYSAICGYREDDLTTVFAPELEGLDREKIRAWYNGYNWTGEAVYNPFDLLLLFREHDYRPFWYETGSPSFLLKVLRQRPNFLPNLSRTLAGYELLSTFDVENIATEALLFQTGYLTIRERQEFAAMATYTLDFPNLEVRTSLLAALARDWTAPESRISQTQPKLIPLLQRSDFEGMRTLMTGFFASIPHQWYTNNPIGQYEGYYASVFYAFFASLGLDVRVEESSNAGRLDMAVLLDNRALIFEFKLVEDAPEGKALAQILSNGYDQPHRAAGREVHCIGIEFSKAKRNIVGWDVA
jgi:hypothetical protein